MSADALWTFAVAFYDRPGVSGACLQLQDDYGADVNMVLFALWCASRGSVLDAASLAAADAAVAPWREAIVRGIRQVRRALKPPPGPPFDPAETESLRQKLLSAELLAERLQLQVLPAFAPPPGTKAPAAAAEANLANLARWAGLPADAAPLRTMQGAFM
ncbi:MAG: TIGR02444 family protein [Acetobacteraceae bacterium]